MGNSPVNGLDPLGLFDLNDFNSLSTGFGDGLSLGLTAKMRQWLNIGGVDTCSGWYTGGQIAGGIALGLATGGLGAEAEEAGETEEVLEEITGCFVAGTPVPLAAAEVASGSVVAVSLSTQASSVKPIEAIKQGDVVASRNPLTGKTESKKVVRTFKHTAYEIVHLELADGKTGKIVESLRGTPEHPFFTPSGKIGMGQLKAGMLVITRRGPPLVVKSVTREHHPEGISVYNFEVEGDHTYFVGTANGGAWVHNNCFSSEEQAIADYLGELGHTVSKNPLEGVAGAGRQGDAYVDGVLHEFKTLNPGATPSTIRNVVNNSIRRGGQARNIVFDARGSGLSLPDAQNGVRRALGISRGLIDNISVIGDDFFWGAGP